MDAEQQLICKGLGSLETYQAVLYCPKKESTYFPGSGDHIQLLHDGSCHCLLTFTWSGRVQICDSLCTNLTSISKKIFEMPLSTSCEEWQAWSNGYRFTEVFSKSSKQVSIILDKIVDLQFTLSNKGFEVTWPDLIL